MTDFSQILQREIEPIKEASETTDKQIVSPVLDVKKNFKESDHKATPPAPKKEIKKVGRKRNPQPTTTKEEKTDSILSKEVANPIWLTMSEAANLGGIQKKTIKRAILSHLLKYRIVDNRYQVELRSVLLYFLSKKKLCNKLKEHGLGQYVEKWRS
jgi:ribosomal protein S25